MTFQNEIKETQHKKIKENIQIKINKNRRKNGKDKVLQN